MRPKITQKVAGLEFESHAWVKRKKKVKCLFSQASEVNVWISSVLRLQNCGSQPWLCAAITRGGCQKGSTPTDCDLIGLGAARVILMGSQLRHSL